MKPKDHGVRAPLFELKSEEWSGLWSNGTCFIATYRNHLFILSAGHVFAHDARIADAQVWINSNTFVGRQSAFSFDLTSTCPPLLTRSLLENVDPADLENALDFVFARVNRSQLATGALEGVRIWSLDDTPVACDLPEGMPVTVLGYPAGTGKDQVVDNENNRADFVLRHARAHLHHSSPYMRCVRLVQVESDFEGSYDGFSGGPGYIGDDEDPILIGIAILGSCQISMIHLLDIDSVKQVLDGVLHQYPSEAVLGDEGPFSIDMFLR